MSRTARFTSIRKLFASNSSPASREVVGVVVETIGERFIVTLSILLGRRGHVGGRYRPSLVAASTRT